MIISKDFKSCTFNFQKYIVFTSLVLQKYIAEKIIMGRQASLFKLLVEYFDQPEQSIEESIIINVEEKINILLKDITDEISRSKRRKQIVNSKISKISNVLDNLDSLIKKAEKSKGKSSNSIDGIKLIKSLIRLSDSLEKGATATCQEISEIYVYFDKIKNLKIKAGGLSDTSIDRMKSDETMWKRTRIENLYKYWFDSQYKNETDFIKDFGFFLDKKLATEKRDKQMLYVVKDFLKDQDKDIDCNCFIQLFRKMKVEKEEMRNIIEVDDVPGYIVNEIKKAFNNNNPESVGLCEEEFQNIISDLAEQLIADLAVYCKKEKNYTTIIRKDNFRALIRYRLCNKLYNFYNKESIYRMLAFRIFQEEFPGNICIHPAAKIDSGVFISDYVMIGKQCHVHSDTYLKDCVCLFPFKSYETDMEDPYIVIGEGTILDKSTRIIGIVDIGKQCYINYNGIISKDIEDMSKIDSRGKKCKMSENEYLEILKGVKGEIYE